MKGHNNDLRDRGGSTWMIRSTSMIIVAVSPYARECAGISVQADLMAPVDISSSQDPVISVSLFCK